MLKAIRPPAVPLVTVDPYFSVWSCADQLYDDTTKHWTGKPNAMTGVAIINDIPYRFCGRLDCGNQSSGSEIQAMSQMELTVSPLSSEYVFTAGGVELTVKFTTPILPYNLDMISRPFSYVDFSVRSLNGCSHTVKIYFDISGEWCVDTTEQEVTWGKLAFDTAASLYMGTVEQKVLNSAGDDKRIDWGYVHLVMPKGNAVEEYLLTASQRHEFLWHHTVPQGLPQQKMQVKEEHPLAAYVVDLETISAEGCKFFIGIAYDDIKSIEYFGQPLDAWWRRDGMSFAEMVNAAVKDHDAILKECAAFDKQLLADAAASGGDKYADLLAIAYRQAFAAHKLVADADKNVLFMSKECFSNGCIATVDVSYPSIPLFLLYNPELVNGMLRPVFKYAKSGQWPYEFAPHDVGTYPLANGQVYGLENNHLLMKYQMPIEECGNMLVMVAATAIAQKDTSLAQENFDLLQQWADYLVANGIDPENQLCTDDFAGHLAHNCNLSVKAVVGIACFGTLCSMLGYNEKSANYSGIAKKMADQWVDMAKAEGRCRLTFDGADTWSLKYNMVWDDILGLQLFSEQIKTEEVNWYAAMQNEYGIPLDSRKDYTKTDWLVWAATLTDNREAFRSLIAPLWHFANTTPSRVPFTDWYDTKTGRMVGFQHRTVIGGIFIRLLKDKNILL